MTDRSPENVVSGDELEQSLAELTAPASETTSHWRTALWASGHRQSVWLAGSWKWAAAAVFVVLFLSSILLPSLSGAREQGRRAAKLARAMRAEEMSDVPNRLPAAALLRSDITRSETDQTVSATPSAGIAAAGGGPPASPRAGGTAPATSSPAVIAAERYVVRKASIELAATDVRAAFAKCALLVSEAQGEYIQESSLTGSGRDTQASLTLRVTADRLSSVLNALRELGQVQRESSGGEDVTSQVVDIDAHLTNERRVEAELLQLLEKRQDANLKDVLELRNAIKNVREVIEQLSAQQERLARLVSLATVLVLIRPSDAPPPPVEIGLGAHVLATVKDALRSAAYYLIDSIAALLRIVIGGLLWWVLLGLTVLVIRHYVRKARADG